MASWEPGLHGKKRSFEEKTKGEKKKDMWERKILKRMKVEGFSKGKGGY